LANMAEYLTKSIIREFSQRESSRRAVDDYTKRYPFPAKAHIFLSHSHNDAQGITKDDLRALWAMLIALNCDVYIDWLDPDMPSQTCEGTAKRIKEKIDGCDRFLLAATSNAVNSRWVPWELGYADKAKGVSNIAVLPIADPYGQWEGAEYIRLYPTVQISTTGQLGVFPPSSSSGRLIGSWMSYGA
jgi:hypothetical protein